MNGDIRYRLFFNDEPVSREELDRVENITVEQEIDMAWEAQLEVPICLDANGRWVNANESNVKTARRVRVEISVGRNEFVPLIDGPVVDTRSKMAFQPGHSSATMLVRDDSYHLDREVEDFSFDDQSDRDIITDLFGREDTVADSDVVIDDDVASGAGDSPPFRLRGTPIEALRCLARRYGMHVNVLPGERPGESAGCFRNYPEESGETGDEAELPEMVLSGANANITELNTRRASARPAGFTASTLSISDKEQITTDASFRDRTLLGDRDALAEGEEEAGELISPSPCVPTDPDQAVRTRAESSSYVFESTGNIVEGCYRGILLPYRLVSVRLGETPKSGTYIIRRVTHTLTRSSYSQSFALIGNAESEIDGDTTASTARSIF
jgi:hypothetical protein